MGLWLCVCVCVHTSHLLANDACKTREHMYVCVYVRE